MKQAIYLLTLLLGTLLLSAPTQAALSWSSQLPREGLPVKVEKSGGGHAHGGQREGKPFYLRDGVGAEVEVWSPTLVRRPLGVDERGVVKVPATGLDSYHLLYARRKGEGRDELALRYQSLRGKPSGESPRRLIGYRKGALDIVPSPLTREHQRYQSGESFAYTLLFRNKPLASHPIRVTTSNGSTLSLQSDAEGRLEVALPEDFGNVQAGRRANRPAEFVLTAEHRVDGVAYTTTLSADYYVNPSHWQSRSGGLLAMFAGFAGGLLVLRRSRNGAKEESDA
jgi:hypothetical protein